MPVIEIAGKQVTVNDEGFMTVYDEWSEEIAKVLAAQVEIELTPRHWEVIHFLREDFKNWVNHQHLAIPKLSVVFQLKNSLSYFQKTCQKMSYIAGLPKPKGCV